MGIALNAEAFDDDVWGDDELSWQLWVVNQIGELLAAAPNLSCPPVRERIGIAISAIVNQVTEGNILAFSNLIRTWHSTVFGYLRKYYPDLCRAISERHANEHKVCVVRAEQQRLTIRQIALELHVGV